jgi:hypothetical protein
VFDGDRHYCLLFVFILTSELTATVLLTVPGFAWLVFEGVSPDSRQAVILSHLTLDKPLGHYLGKDWNKYYCQNGADKLKNVYEELYHDCFSLLFLCLFLRYGRQSFHQRNSCRSTCH